MSQDKLQMLLQVVRARQEFIRKVQRGVHLSYVVRKSDIAKIRQVVVRNDRIVSLNGISRNQFQVHRNLIEAEFLSKGSA